MAEFPAPKDGIVLTHFIVSNDVESSSHFYTDVLGGELVLDGEPSIVTWGRVSQIRSERSLGARDARLSGS